MKRFARSGARLWSGSFVPNSGGPPWQANGSPWTSPRVSAYRARDDAPISSWPAKMIRRTPKLLSATSFRKEVADKSFGVLRIILAGHDEIGASSLARYADTRGLVQGDPFACHVGPPEFGTKEPLQSRAPLRANLFMDGVVRRGSRYHM